MGKVSNHIRNLSVSKKFAAAYSIILILQIILTGFYLYFQASNSAISQGKLVMEQNLMQTKASILEKVKVIENVSSLITLNEGIQDFLEYEYTNDAYRVVDYQFKFSPMMKNILIQNDTINSIKTYMSNSIVIEKLSSFNSVSSKSDKTLYDKMLKEKPQVLGWTGVHSSYDNNFKSIDQVFSFSSKIISRNSFQSIGMVEIEVKEKTLFDMLRNRVTSQFGKVFVIDSKGKIVSNNIPQLFGKSVLEYGITNYKRDSNSNIIENINNTRSIVITIPIKEMGCSIVGIFPTSNFNSKVKESVTTIIILLLILSIIIGCIIYLTTNVLLIRIKKLVRAMKQVREGNLDVSVEVKSEDEFGELAVSFNHMTGRINDLVETVYKIQLMEKEAELKALEAQINPHFLYNTLATISWIARKENFREVTQITNSLAKFYRLVLNKGNTLISVKDEIEIVSAYLYIQKTRFEDKLEVIYDIDEKVYNYNIVKNILQPVVENALIHGIENKRGNSTIIIKAGESDNRLYFKIIDDGLGINKSTLKDLLNGTVRNTKGSGYAVRNIMERLRAYYGEGQSFDIFSRPGFGTVVTITVDKDME